MNGYSAKHALMTLVLCGAMSGGAYAAERTIYEDDYATVIVTENDESLTYTDADGNERTYDYAAIARDSDTGVPDVSATVTDLTDLNLNYESPNDGANEAYYAWVKDGDGNYAFQEVTSSADAQVTVRYATDSAYSDGLYNIDSTLGDISADFVGDSAHGAGEGNADIGGAIDNRATAGNTASLGTITGNFIGNYEIDKDAHVYGGAIANYSSYSNATVEIETITGNFIGNYVKASESDPSETDANDEPVHHYAQGGAIYNMVSAAGSIASIGEITGNFIGNYTINESTSYKAPAKGGAIYNSGSHGAAATIGDITGDFIGNMSQQGGAIYNYGGGNDDDVAAGTLSYGKIGDITGNFIGNSVTTSGEEGSDVSYALGGAIYNYANLSGGTAEIGAITGDFIGNYVESSLSYVYGGAIYNEGNDGGNAVIGDITGNFIGNYVTTSGTYAYGGAIYNENGAIGAIKGDFIGNYARSTGSSDDSIAWGGAINNIGGSIQSIEGNFIGNYAASDANDSYGGAIYNEGMIGVADDAGEVSVVAISNSSFQGNSATRGGAIYNGTYASATNEDADDSGGATTEASYTGLISSIEKSSFIGNVAYKYGGAIYNYADGVIWNIEDNYFVENVAENGNGGAIENAEAQSTIGTIKGNYFYRNDVSESDHGGAAIYSEGIISSITDNDFVENTSGNFGGAIYNNGGGIGGTDSATGNAGEAVSGNYFQGNESNRGGAIYNTTTRTLVTVEADGDGNPLTQEEILDLDGYGVIMSIEDNAFVKNVANNYGGAIYNYHGGEIGSISNNRFEGNEAKGGNGGAVENAEFDATIGNMDGNVFADNTASGNGGAVYNQGTIGIERGSGDVADKVTGGISNSTFTGNTAENGGAVYNNVGVGNVYVLDAAGDTTFGEYTVSSIDVYGAGAIGNITQSYFEGNKAVNGSGGAIYNASRVLDYTDAEGAETSAVYTATINSITNTSFVENSATENGGAIYSASSLNIVADGSMDGGDVVFKGNTAGSDDNAVYMAADAAGAVSTVSFDLRNEGAVYLYDNIRGDEGYGVQISGDGTKTVFYLLNDAYAADLSVGNASTDAAGALTLSTVDGDVHHYAVSRFTVAGSFDMVADVDLKNEAMDSFVTDGNAYGNPDNVSGVYGEAKGTLNVAGMNLISDTSKDSVAVYFAEPGLMNDVTSSVGTVYSPVYRYDLDYEVYDENYAGDYDPAMFGNEGGYFVFNKAGNNPAVMLSSVAQMGAYNAMNLMFEYNFEHSDYYMKLPRATRLAEDGGGAAETKNSAPNELAKGGAWVKPFFSEDKVSYRGSYSSRDKYYGALVGVDSDLHESASGWASVFTAYMGYLGVRQDYSGGSVDQRGGVVGATANFYKDNFYSAWTAAFSSMKANGHTMYGREYTHSNIYGIATKTGWHFDSENGKYSFLPTFMASYTYVDTRDYDNAAGVHMDSHGMHAIQLKPNVKFLLNLDDGWQPYLTAGEVWTVAQSASVYADGDRLAEELSLKPYTEYGGGVQKRWEEYGCDAYLEVLGHAGGRRGVAVTAGMRWNF